MPQLDIVSFFNQTAWLSLIFFLTVPVLSVLSLGAYARLSLFRCALPLSFYPKPLFPYFISSLTTRETAFLDEDVFLSYAPRLGSHKSSLYAKAK